jgi:hypothetical protein
MTDIEGSGWQMIEIKCTDKEKDMIVNAIARSQYCLVDDCPPRTLCSECAEKSISWTIRGNEDAE